MNAKHLEKLLPLIGSVVLFVAWAVQQLLFASWNASLSRIGASEAVFHSYRATNGVFRALSAMTSAEAGREVEQQQLQNYERGLAILASSVDPQVYADSRARGIESLDQGVKPEDLSTNARIMLEFEAMQRTLASQRSTLVSRKALAETAFLWLYGFGTLLVIAGGAARWLAARAEPPAK